MMTSKTTLAPVVSTPTVMHLMTNRFMAATNAGLADNTIISFRMALDLWLAWAGNLLPENLTVNNLNDFIGFMEKRDNCHRSIRFRLWVVRKFYEWMVDEKFVPDEVMDVFISRRMRRLTVIKKTKSIITLAEHQAILKEINRKPGTAYWRCAVMLGWHCGLRISDVCMIRWENINWESEAIELTPKKTRRFGKQVTIPMDEELGEFLLKLKAQPYYTSPFIIPYMAGQYANGYRNVIQKAFCYLTLKAGVDRSFHCYRHAFVSKLVNAGIEPIVICSMTGQSLNQIADYAHVSVEAQRDALAKARQVMHKHHLREKGIIP